MTRSTLALSEQGVSDIRLADTSRSIPLDRSVDMILTSPPYCTRIDYTVATRVELALLHPLLNESAESLARQMTGTTKVPDEHIEAKKAWGPTCSSFLRAVRSHPSKASDGYYYKTHLDYFDKMFRSLGQCANVLREGGTAVLVVQDSYYKDVHNDLPRIISEMAHVCGLKLGRREDFSISRSMARLNPRARAYEHQTGATESVLCLQK